MGVWASRNSPVGSWLSSGAPDRQNKAQCCLKTPKGGKRQRYLGTMATEFGRVALMWGRPACVRWVWGTESLAVWTAGLFQTGPRAHGGCPVKIHDNRFLRINPFICVHLKDFSVKLTKAGEHPSQVVGCLGAQSWP